MLRLLYLLLRQETHRDRATAYTALTRRHRPGMLVLGVIAVSAGAVLILCYGLLQSGPAPLGGVSAGTATLQLRVDAVHSAPLVVYLETTGASVREEPESSEVRVRITSINSSFQPVFQVAPLASSVEVGNEDPIPHNTHVFDGQRTLFNVAVPIPGVRVHKTLGHPGIFDVRCDFHPWMRAWLFVPPGPHHAVVWAAGETTLRDIAPGSYRLHAWAAASGDTIHTLTFGPGEIKALHLAGA
jgi:plastocyanin